MDSFTNSENFKFILKFSEFLKDSKIENFNFRSKIDPLILNLYSRRRAGIEKGVNYRIVAGGDLASEASLRREAPLDRRRRSYQTCDTRCREATLRSAERASEASVVARSADSVTSEE